MNMVCWSSFGISGAVSVKRDWLCSVQSFCGNILCSTNVLRFTLSQRLLGKLSQIARPASDDPFVEDSKLNSIGIKVLNASGCRCSLPSKLANKLLEP